MDLNQVADHWDLNADAWTKLSRAGYDVYRDYLNTPAFFEMLPDIRGLYGLDIGCGEGHNTRLLAKRGANISAIDISKVFIKYAREKEINDPLNIDYQIASATEMPFPDSIFDFATGFMSFMDTPKPGQVLTEVYRVLKPGGFIQFSICHPCFDTPHRKKLCDEKGQAFAFEIGDYFRNLNGEISEWIFTAAPEKVRKGLSEFEIPVFTMTVSQWLNLLIDSGFNIERIGEPRPDDETVKKCPKIQDAQVIAYYLHIRARKLDKANA